MSRREAVAATPADDRTGIVPGLRPRVSMMGLVHLVAGRLEVARRRPRAGASAGTRPIEAWPDLRDGELVWVGDEAKQALDAAGDPLASVLALPEDAVRVYYGPQLRDLPSLPTEQSLKGRILSARGVAAAWATYDAQGAFQESEPAAPDHPLFHLRRPGSQPGHLWRLFRTRDEAQSWISRERPGDEEAQGWAAALPADDFDDLVARFAVRG